MNPDTGEFVPDGPTVPEEWPRFTIGEQVELKGFPFTIARINAATIVLRPMPVENMSPRRVFRKLTIKEE
jgi:hypothetical protein